MIGVDTITALLQSRGRGDPTSALGEIFNTPLTRVLQYLDAKIQFSRTEQALDTIITALASQDTLNNFALQLDEDVATIEKALSLAVDAIASNLGITRRPAVTSRGNIIVYRADSLIDPITINAGTTFTAPLLAQDYTSRDTVIIYSMNWDSDLDKYIYAIPIESVNTGTATVAATSQVTKISDSINGIDGCTNTDPVIGGRDEESDQELADRAKTALSANNIGTKSGYRGMVMGIDTVKDASVVGAGDPLMVRDMGDGGSVDIYVTDAIPVQAGEVAVLGTNLIDSSGTGVGPWIFSPARQPVLVAVVTPAGGTIHKDTSIFAGSITALDTISFVPDVTGLTVTYFVNDNVSQVQTYIDDDSRRILGSDVLIKEVATIPVYISMKITVVSGFSSSVVQGNVQNAVTQFVASLGIGVHLEESDVIRVAVNIDGVDRVELPLIRFDRGTIYTPADIIPAAPNEVLRVGSVAVSY